MVVLARAAALPSRLVVGYVKGSYDFTNARYVVTEADAHAWVEVYFPGVGWVEFEPTGGRPAIDRDTAEEEFIWPEGFELEPLVEPKKSTVSNVVLWQWLALFGTVVIGIAVFTSAGDSLYVYFHKTPSWMISKLYHRLRQNALNIEAFVHDGDTPHEMLEAFSKRIETIAAEREIFKDYITESVYLAGTLVESYIKLWYSPRTDMPRQERWEIAWLWWNLRWRLLLAWLLRRPRKVRPPMPTAPPSDRYVQQPPQTM